MSNALFEAIERGDAAEVRRLIEAGTDLKERLPGNDDYGPYFAEVTPLIAAAAQPGSSVEIVDLILRAGADPHEVSGAKVTALWYAAGAPWNFGTEVDASGVEPPASNDFSACLRLLLDAGLPPDEGAENGRTAVGEACSAKDSLRLALLLERGASVWPVKVDRNRSMDLPDDIKEIMQEMGLDKSLDAEDGESQGFESYAIPLFQAAEAGNAENVSMILARGFPIDFRCGGETAMHSAGNREVAEVLWKAGAPFDVRGEMFDTLDKAFEDERYDVAEFLLAKMPLEDRDGVLQSQLLLSSGVHMNPHAVRILLEWGADPNRPNPDYGSPLHYACWQGDGNMGRLDETVEETVRLLVQAGADPNAWDEDRGTPLHEAVYGDWGSPTSVRVLLELGARPDVAGPGGMTPLMFASLRGEVECVRLLLDAGADRHARAEGGATASDYARSHLRTWRSIVKDGDSDEERAQSHLQALEKAEENARLLE